MMVVSHRESNISTNIRAIIEQLNLNPVERRRLIDRNEENRKSSPPKISIGVYGSKEPAYEIYSEVKKNGIEIQTRSRAENRQRFPTISRRKSDCAEVEL